jgi:amino-acid N-acetyltransferase
LTAVPQLTESILRAALPADVPKMQKVVNTFAESGEMLPRNLSEMYENLRDYLVVESDGDLVGCVALHLVWSDLAEVKSLAVTKAVQGQGVGKKMVNAALDEARRLGLPKVFALTFKPAFFERLGFRLIDKNELPHKIWGECIRCPKFPDCDEQAVIIDL